MRFLDSSWLRYVSSASLSCCLLAPSASQAWAISVTTVICAVRCAASVTKYCCSACSLRLRMRPNRSSSYEAIAALALYTCETTVRPLAETRRGVRWADSLATAATLGRSWPRLTRYRARADSTLCMAARRSRLFSSPMAISFFTRSSVKKSAHSASPSARTCAFFVASSCGQAAAIGASGRS